MKTQQILSNLCSIFLTIAVIKLTTGQTEPEPDFAEPRYYSECWRGDGESYPRQVYPDTGLFAWSDITSNEPVYSYPFASGHVEGMSDTVLVYVHFRKRDTGSYDLTYKDPTEWFMPVIYDQYVDPLHAEPIADTTTLKYKFLTYMNSFDSVKTKPDVIPYSGDCNDRFYMLYTVWNIPVGRYRLLMEKTISAPGDFVVILNWTPCVWITKAQSMRDSVNAHASIFWRCYYSGSTTNLTMWLDSIFTYNPNAIPGYLLKATERALYSDTLGAVTALDSVIAIMERYGDPVMSDSTKFSDWEKLWYDDMLGGAKHGRWSWITGIQRAKS